MLTGSRVFAALLVALGTGCAARHAMQAAPGRAAVAPAQQRTSAVYRFVSSGARNSLTEQALGAGRVGIITGGGLSREVVGPDGSVERAPDLASTPLLGGVPIPARLGAGYLFWSARALYRAHSFVGPLEAVAPLPTNVIGVEFGPDFVLVFAPESRPRAFSLGPPGELPLSPRGVIDVASADDGCSVALDATGRALASTDGGKSWKDVTRALAAPTQALREDAQGAAFVLSKDAAVGLQKDGQLTPRPVADAASAAPGPQASDWLRRAVVAGLPVSGAQALVADDAHGTALVDLESGSVSSSIAAAPAGSCVPISLAEEGLVMCVAYGAKTTTTIVSHARGADPQVEKTFAGAVQVLPGHALSVVASCSGAATEGVACIRRSPGVWVEVSVGAELLKAWKPVSWLPRDDGTVAVIASERGAQGRMPTAALIEPTSGSVTPWDASIDQVMPDRAAGSLGSSFRLFTDGTLRGFTATGVISVDAKGHVSRSPRTFASISSAGARALARDGADRLWQTSDYGAHWVEIAPPPFDSMPIDLAPRLFGDSSGRTGGIHCSLVGCALDHLSGTGSWLRMGWSEDPPRASATDGSDGKLVITPLPLPSPLPSPALPTLRCRTRSAGPLRARPTPTPRRGQADAEIRYRDAFSLPERYVGYGLRAVVQHKALDVRAGTRDQPVESHVSIGVQFVEPLDPAARTRQITASLRSGSETALDAQDGTARPVLSPEPGHAGGLLLVKEGLSFFLTNAGKAQPLPSGCTPASGYVDARGKLFVACAEWSGATRIEDALDGRSLLSLPPAAHFRREPRVGMSAFPPGSPVFVNPDSIAVGQDGSLRILRLAPGAEPPTTDDPAWLLSDDAAPVDLAPWSSLELATTPACLHGDGYRALIQTARPWVRVDDSTGVGRAAGMTALVRWSTERVCLEAIEVGFGELGQTKLERPVQVMAVARFVGKGVGSGLLGAESTSTVREPATCELDAPPKQ
jgi:hypothetical protein